VLEKTSSCRRKDSRFVHTQIFGTRPSFNIRDQTRHKMETTAQHYNPVCKCTHLHSVGVWRNVWAGNGPISDFFTPFPFCHSV